MNGKDLDHKSEFGEQKCRNKWLLNLDADEVLSPELVIEIRQLFRDCEPKKHVWKIPIIEIFPGETNFRKFAYQLSPVRLYNRDYGQFSASIVHDRVKFNNNVQIGKLNNKIYHYSTISLGRDIQKYNQYTNLQIEEIEANGRILAPWRIVTEFPLAFFKAYFFRLYIFRGRLGYLLSMNYAIFRHLRIAKHFERRIIRKTKIG